MTEMSIVAMTRAKFCLMLNEHQMANNYIFEIFKYIISLKKIVL